LFLTYPNILAATLFSLSLSNAPNILAAVKSKYDSSPLACVFKLDKKAYSSPSRNSENYCAVAEKPST